MPRVSGARWPRACSSESLEVISRRPRQRDLIGARADARRPRVISRGPRVPGLTAVGEHRKARSRAEARGAVWTRLARWAAVLQTTLRQMEKPARGGLFPLFTLNSE